LVGGSWKLIRASIVRGFSAGKRNVRAGLLLWVVGLVVVGGYYQIDAVGSWLTDLSDWKMKHGWLFPAVSTALAGGLAPVLLRRWFNGDKGAIANDGPFYVIFWAVKGMEVELFYRLQALWFGAGADWQTIVIKTAVDQFLYVPLWAGPTMIGLIEWHQVRYRWSDFVAVIKQDWIRRQLIPIIISGWCVWIPAVSLIYCLPTPLQLPLQNLVLCLWMLILAVLTTSSNQEAQ
jgi:hypothetical protein